MIDWRETLAGAVLAIIIILSMIFLSGCATTFQGLCLVRPVGVTDGGLNAIAVQCEAVE